MLSLLIGLVAFATVGWTKSQAPTVYAAVAKSDNPSSVNVPAPVSLPSDGDSLEPVDPSFMAFAFEQSWLPQYLGTRDDPNYFSVNCIRQITSRTGSLPYIRVGGTSLEASTYVPSQQKAVKIPPDQRFVNTPLNVTYGPSYFNSFGVVPNALYNICIPQLTQNLQNSALYAEAAYQNIGAENIEQLTVGQEESLYPPVNRPASYGPPQYIKEWARYTSVISKRLGIPLNEQTYAAIGIFGPAEIEGNDATIPGWDVISLFEAGLSKYIPRMTSVGIHYYQTASSSDSNIQRDLMNHTAVSFKLDTYKTSIDYAKSIGLPPIFEEVGSSYNGDRNDYQLESVLGSTLWNIDFHLYAMSLGVYRVNYQQGLIFGYSLWTPSEREGRKPAVQVPYYGHLFAAEFIGKDFPVKVTNINLNSDLMSAYAAYNSDTGELARVALVNFQFWSSFYSTFPRPQTTFALKAPAGAKRATVKFLSSSVGATASRSEVVTWGGQVWSYLSQCLPYERKALPDDTLVLQVKSGKITVPVFASQAAMVTFQ